MWSPHSLGRSLSQCQSEDLDYGTFCFTYPVPGQIWARSFFPCAISTPSLKLKQYGRLSRLATGAKWTDPANLRSHTSTKQTLWQQYHHEEFWSPSPWCLIPSLARLSTLTLYGAPVSAQFTGLICSQIPLVWKCRNLEGKIQCKKWGFCFPFPYSETLRNIIFILLSTDFIPEYKT